VTRVILIFTSNVQPVRNENVPKGHA
jgi:hypothetical protein